MRTLIFIFNLLQIVTFTFGQEPVEKKNILNFSIGQSIATKDFGDLNANNPKAGLAGKGWHFNFNYYRKLSPYLGAGIKCFVNKNTFEPKDLIRKIDSASGQIWNISVKTDWYSYGAFAGISAFLPVGKIIFYTKWESGIIFLDSPSVKYIISNTQNWIKQNSISSHSFGYNINAGVSYLDTKQWSIFTSIDYTGSIFYFKDSEVYSSMGPSQEVKGGFQVFNIINFTVGIGYNF